MERQCGHPKAEVKHSLGTLKKTRVQWHMEGPRRYHPHAEVELIEPLRKHVQTRAEINWSEEQLEEGMLRAQRKTRGVGGVDGYHGTEIA